MDAELTMMTDLMQKVLVEADHQPESEQDTLAGLMLAYLILKEGRDKAHAYNAKLWARLRDEDPDYIRQYNKGQRRNREKAEHFIGLILLVDWDPIGVFGIPAPQNEYARYVPEVYKLLLSYPSVETVAEHLYHIEREEMGVWKKAPLWQAARRAVLMQVAQKLVGLSWEWKEEAVSEELPS